MKNAVIEFAGKTDTGLVRSQNEDAIAISSAYGFAVLADGMGGYNAGEVASRIAIETTRSVLEDSLATASRAQAEVSRRHAKYIHQITDEAVRRANTAILDAARDEPEYSGMGTTIVVAVFHHDKVMIAHVGDSRAYRIRDGKIEQITRDHSLLQEQIDAGLVTSECARFSQHKNLVTRAVGVGQEMEVEIHDHHVRSGDIYLLCSDGLSDMLQEGEMHEILVVRQGSLEEKCDLLVKQANDNGGLDNISVILACVCPGTSGARGIWSHVLNWVNQKA